VILIIDNYDSFAYNIVQHTGELGYDPQAYRNDRITLEEIASLEPTHIIISPGPGTPREAGISNDVIRRFAGHIPILGICLGHQCLGEVYGARIVGSPRPVHGQSSLIHHDGKTIYQGLTNPFPGGRYHSLVPEWDTPPPEIEISARTEDGIIMGIRHRTLVLEGVQFHPESVMTEVGRDLLRNFLKIRSATRKETNNG